MNPMAVEWWMIRRIIVHDYITICWCTEIQPIVRKGWFFFCIHAHSNDYGQYKKSMHSCKQSYITLSSTKSQSICFHSLQWTLQQPVYCYGVIFSEQFSSRALSTLYLWSSLMSISQQVHLFTIITHVLLYGKKNDQGSIVMHPSCTLYNPRILLCIIINNSILAQLETGIGVNS